MADEQTMKDHIEDLMIERNQLLQQVRTWQNIAIKAFNTSHGHIQDCTVFPCVCGWKEYAKEITK